MSRRHVRPEDEVNGAALVLCLVLGALGGFWLHGAWDQEPPTPFEVLCAYRNGTPEGDVCVRNGKTIEVPREVLAG